MKTILLAFPTLFEANGLICLMRKNFRWLPTEGALKGSVGEAYLQKKNQNEQIRLLFLICGIGEMHTTLRLEAFFKLKENSKPDLIILAGFAGALQHGWKKGDIAIPNTPIAQELLKKIKHSCYLNDNTQLSFRLARFHTSKKTLFTAPEKAELAKATGAECVDMEFECVQAIANAHQIPLICIRAISDLANEDLPTVLKYGYDIQQAKPTPLRLCMHFIKNPWRIPSFFRFIRPLKRVRCAFTSFITHYLSVFT